ncbi:MAG: hypothetical protein KGJ84_09650 [Elusimicrobia bacterium]|nr:hypothetical protein [Elusimicrobiota bacterium]
MRRALPLLFAASVLAAGCGGRSTVKAEKSQSLDPAAVKAVAAAANAAADGSSKPQPAGPQRGEAESRSGKILGKDSEGCTWVEGEALVVVGEQDSRHQARAAAIEQARAAAVQDFLGVDVKSKLMDFEQEGLRHEEHLTESLLETTRNGRIIKEKIIEEGFRDMPDCPACRYHVVLKSCVLPRDPNADKDFHVELNLSRTRFVQGDEARMTLTATRDCSVYLYDVYDLADKDKTALIVPNEAVPTKTLKAGETWEYPDDEAKRRGVHLIAELPKPTDEVSAEVIRVVATVTPLPAAVYDPADGGYLGVLRRLNRSRTEWAEDAQAFVIYKK